MRALVVVSALLVSSAAAAQPVAPDRTAFVAEARSSRAFPALALSTGALAAGLAVTAAVHQFDGRGGLTDPAYLVGAAVAALAPSAGNLWLGETGDALTGAALRAGGVVAITYALDHISFLSGSGDGADLALFAGLLLYTGGFGYDVVTQVDNGDRAAVALRPTRDGLALTVSL